MQELTNVYDTEIVEEPMAISGAMQIKTAYTTAMQVIKPRNLAVVERRCLEEAAIAGDEFYYSWKQGSSIIEGLTVGASMSIARNMGNCAVPVTVEETKDTYIFTATFVDLETGFNLSRMYRQRKGQNLGEKMKKDGRAEDVVFQVGQSKAIRNSVLGAIPKWLQNKVMAKAKENVVGKIEQMGKEKAREMLLKKADALKISGDILEAEFGKSTGWDVEKLVQISGALRGIEDGILSMSEAFPTSKEQAKEDTGLNALAKKTSEQNIEPTTQTADPYIKLKVELRKQGVGLKEAEAFIAAKNIAPEEVEELSKDIEGLKVAFAEWRQENAK